MAYTDLIFKEPKYVRDLDRRSEPDILSLPPSIANLFSSGFWNF